MDVSRRTVDELELLARLSVHVPLPRRHHVRYYGAYSTRLRGQLRAEGIIPNPAAEGKLRAACRQSWAKLIRLVYEDDAHGCASVGGYMEVREPTDPLLCPVCGSGMKLKGLTGPAEARAKLALFRPMLLFWRDGAAARAISLQQFMPPP